MKYYSFEKILEDIKENLCEKYKKEESVKTTGFLDKIDCPNKRLKIRSCGEKRIEECLELYWVDENEKFYRIEVGDFVEIVFTMNDDNTCELVALKKLG